LRIARAGVFSKLANYGRARKSVLSVKTRLYEALVLSTLLNSAEMWPFSFTQMKKTRCSTPQMATKYPGDFLEGQSNI